MKHKFDLNGNKIVILKCKLCGKPKGDHKAKTYECPLGLKNRTMGYTSYSKEVFR